MDEVENTNPHQLPPMGMKNSILKSSGIGAKNLLGGANNGARKVSTSQHVRARTGITHQNSQKVITSTSPFRKLNDEEVFITRETEKQKRKEAKEQAKSLKIWDKKTATSRQPLQRVKDGDIPPAQLDDNAASANHFSFNTE